MAPFSGCSLSYLPLKQSTNAPTSAESVRDDATQSEPTSLFSISSPANSQRKPTLFQRFAKLVGGSTGTLTEYSPVNDAGFGANADEEKTLKQDEAGIGDGYQKLPWEEEGNESGYY
ncbi:hypothetical protein MKZ38_002985 [Zalerion maritima]|uniref:Uncharacterized protein n=1 Tax=Zalerion maritima TaxID=339359 RepID=A0AAD5WQV9_9PEZI|nr:hypothetical protein MKZ38_002985 [Zalerion maritima]